MGDKYFLFLFVSEIFYVETIIVGEITSSFDKKRSGRFLSVVDSIN